MAIDYEVEYNNRARVPEHPAILAGWTRDAEAYREQLSATEGRAVALPARENLRRPGHPRAVVVFNLVVDGRHLPLPTSLGRE